MKLNTIGCRSTGFAVCSPDDAIRGGATSLEQVTVSRRRRLLASCGHVSHDGQCRAAGSTTADSWGCSSGRQAIAELPESAHHSEEDTDETVAKGEEAGKVVHVLSL